MQAGSEGSAMAICNESWGWNYIAVVKLWDAGSDKVGGAAVTGAVMSSAGLRPVCASSFPASLAASSAMVDVGHVATIPGSMARRGSLEGVLRKIKGDIRKL